MSTMTCEKCKKDHATYHLTAIENGQKKETHLCEGCARNSGVGLNFNFSLSNILGSVTESKSKTKGGSKTKCPECGMTFTEFKKQMRLGCANDYEIFEKELNELVTRIHGSNQHVGKVPGKAEDPDRKAIEAAKLVKEKENRLMQLKKELDAAVVAENYEKAAKLRDEIKTAENELPKKT